MVPSMSTAAQLNLIAFIVYERLGGTEGLDRLAEEAAYAGEFIPDEDGDQAYAEMLERRAQDWADREDCPDWAR